MQCTNIIKFLNMAAPESYACDWDNVGLLVGSRQKEVKRVYIALDATDEVITEAVSFEADMLITHHPLIFSGQKRVVDEDFIGRRIQKLIQNDISYYAMHTNFDISAMADLSAAKIGLYETEVLEELFKEESVAKGIGKIGNFKESMTLCQCAELVKAAFHIPNVKVFGDMDRMISRAAICPGSGKSEIPYALQTGAQVLITGDIDHHNGIDAVAQGLCIIDAGHYGLEHIFVPYMKEYLKSVSNELMIYTREEKFPFDII